MLQKFNPMRLFNGLSGTKTGLHVSIYPPRQVSQPSLVYFKLCDGGCLETKLLRITGRTRVLVFAWGRVLSWGDVIVTSHCVLQTQHFYSKMHQKAQEAHFLPCIENSPCIVIRCSFHYPIIHYSLVCCFMLSVNNNYPSLHLQLLMS